jgi:hypothetical protein
MGFSGDGSLELFDGQLQFLELHKQAELTLRLDNVSPRSTLLVHMACSPGLARSVDNGPTWTRTRDQPVMSRPLCQLSYGPPTLLAAIAHR